MLKELIFHKVDSDYAYAFSEKEVVIKLKAKRDDLKRVVLNYTDKYYFIFQSKKMIKKEMEKVAFDKYFDYFEVKIEYSFISMAYCFRLEDEEQIIYYGSKGFSEKKFNHDSRMFVYPSLEKYDLFKTPDWAKESIVYQIFPERFYRGDSYTVVKENGEWYGKVDNFSMLGGTLRGIIDKLDYLENLGINAIYLCPIFKSESNHKYDIDDYFEIDQSFGDKSSFKELVDKSHKRGIKIILDAVLNHSSTNFFAFTDILEKGQKSKYVGWYSIESLPIKGGRYPNYKTFAGYHKMPKLNYDNKEVREYFKKVISYWIEEFDIDGWRFDVADEVPHKFWREARDVIKEVKEDVLLIGEVWYDSSSWLNGDQFDTVMNYDFFNATLDFIAKNSIKREEFLERLDSLRGNYRGQVQKVLWNLIGSHDTPRFLYHAKESKAKLKLAILLQMTLPGTPFVYYGDEIGMTGGKDPDCRRGMLWKEELQDRELFEYVKKLIRIRKENKELLLGDRVLVEQIEEENTLYYRMKHGKDYLDVYINNGTKILEIELDGKYKDLLNECIYDKTMKIKGKSGVILRKIKK